MSISRLNRQHRSRTEEQKRGSTSVAALSLVPVGPSRLYHVKIIIVGQSVLVICTVNLLRVDHLVYVPFHSGSGYTIRTGNN